MFNLAPNPEYVPGGLNNFWTTRPAGQDGQAAGTLAAAGPTSDTATVPPRSFMAGFFKNPAEAEKMSGAPPPPTQWRTNAADGQMVKNFGGLAAAACRQFLPSLNAVDGY